MRTMQPYRFRVTYEDGVTVPITGYATNADTAEANAKQWASEKRKRQRVPCVSVERIED